MARSVKNSWARLASVLVLGLLVIPGHAGAERVLVASNALYAIDTDAGSVQEVAKLGLFVKDLTVDAAGQNAYVATSDGILEVDLMSGAVTREFGDVSARSVQIDGAGNVYGLFTTTPKTHELRGFSLATGDAVGTGALPEGVGMLAFDEKNQSVLHMDHGARTIGFHSGTAASNREVVIPQNYEKPGLTALFPEAIAHDATGTVVAIEQGAEAGVWVIREDAEPQFIALGHEAHIRGSVFSPDGNYLYLSAMDHVAKVDLVKMEAVAWVGLEGVHQRAAMSADGNTLYLTKPVTGNGGALVMLSSDTLAKQGEILVADASPITLAVIPE